MDKARAYLELVHLMHTKDKLPAPMSIKIDGTAVHITLATREEVDRWAKHLALPEPWQVARQAYGTVEFYTRDNPNWIGATVVSISCETKKNEEMTWQKDDHGRTS